MHIRAAEGRRQKVTTSRFWQGLRSQWIVFLAILIIGLALVVAGWQIEGSPYGSDLLLQVGSTLTLLVPLFALEHGLDNRIQDLSTKVERLRLKFVGQVGHELEKQLNDEVLRLHMYVEDAETSCLPRDVVPVRLVTEEESWARLVHEGKEMIAGPKALHDPELVAHVYAHHILQSYEHYKDRLSNSFTAKAVEAGLADYLVAALHDKPYLASVIAPHRGKKGAVRNLANDRKFSEIDFPKDDYDSRDPSSDVFHDAGEVWGGAFWELGGRIGRLRVTRSLLQAWERFDPPTSTSPASPRSDAEFVHIEFIRELLHTSPKHREWVSRVFNRRGLVV